MGKIPSLGNMFYQTQVLKKMNDFKNESQSMNSTMKKFNDSKLAQKDVNLRTSSQENIAVNKELNQAKGKTKQLVNLSLQKDTVDVKKTSKSKLKINKMPAQRDDDFVKQQMRAV